MGLETFLGGYGAKGTEGVIGMLLGGLGGGLRLLVGTLG